MIPDHHKDTKITQRITKKTTQSDQLGTSFFFVFLCVIFVPLW